MGTEKMAMLKMLKDWENDDSTVGLRARMSMRKMSFELLGSRVQLSGCTVFEVGKGYLWEGIQKQET